MIKNKYVLGCHSGWTNERGTVSVYRKVADERQGTESGDTTRLPCVYLLKFLPPIQVVFTNRRRESHSCDVQTFELYYSLERYELYNKVHNVHKVNKKASIR